MFKVGGWLDTGNPLSAGPDLENARNLKQNQIFTPTRSQVQEHLWLAQDGTDDIASTMDL